MVADSVFDECAIALASDKWALIHQSTYKPPLEQLHDFYHLVLEPDEKVKRQEMGLRCSVRLMAAYILLWERDS